MRRALALLLAAAACGDDAITFPVRAAPPSRHDALAAMLADDARAFAFADGDWLEDLDDAPLWGIAWRGGDGRERDAALARARRLVASADGSQRVSPEETLLALVGLIEDVGVTGDRTSVPAIDALVDRLDAMVSAAGDYLPEPTYGPTTATAAIALLHAEYALHVGGARQHIDRAVALDARIRAVAFGDLVDSATQRQVRAYAFEPGRAGLVDAPNVAMLLLKTRLFRLTRDEVFRLEARAIYGALQPLKLTDTRYATPYAKATLGLDTRDLTTLAGQNYIALADLFLFEITGDDRFVTEADLLLDGIAGLRGPYCTSSNRCATGLLHHTADGRLAAPPDPAVFCAGDTLQTLFVLGYRRSLAGQ